MVNYRKDLIKFMFQNKEKKKTKKNKNAIKTDFDYDQNIYFRNLVFALFRFQH